MNKQRSSDKGNVNRPIGRRADTRISIVVDGMCEMLPHYSSVTSCWHSQLWAFYESSEVRKLPNMCNLEWHKHKPFDWTCFQIYLHMCLLKPLRRANADVSLTVKPDCNKTVRRDEYSKSFLNVSSFNDALEVRNMIGFSLQLKCHC